MVQQSRKYRNRQLKKRLQAIQNKLHEYVQLGADVALILRFPEKESGYSYLSSNEFLEVIEQVVGAAQGILKTHY
jgi:hypothetical protein